MKSTREKIIHAKSVLGLSNCETIMSIKKKYRKAMALWHPDVCTETPEICAEKAREVNLAYDTVMAYVRNYEILFDSDTIGKQETPAEWWARKFGVDPIWGPGNS